MDKPIPEAVAQLRRLADVIRRHGTIPSLSLEHIADALTAAQQQGQAVAVDRSDAALEAFNATLVPDLRVQNTLAYRLAMTEALLAAAPASAPPSAPVGVEAAARRLLEAYDGNAHPFEAAAAAQAMRDALAQQPAAVDGATE